MIFNNIIQTNKASNDAWWFLIPSVPVAIYYAYKSTFSYNKNLVFWKNLLGAIVCTIFYSLVLVKSFQGYLYIYNSSFGEQKNYLLQGFINYVKPPKYKNRVFSLYTIDLTLDSSQRKIKLATKTNIYEPGQHIEINMKLGSLGYIYLPK